MLLRDGAKLTIEEHKNSPLIILVIEREQFFKDGVLMERIRQFLDRLNISNAVYERPQTVFRRLLYAEGRFEHLPMVLRRVLKIPILLANPIYWKLLYSSGASYVNSLYHALSILDQRGRVLVLARSAGAVVATQIADQENLCGVVCLGYPFQHPERGRESYRYKHLENIKTPTLIVQGENDIYGGKGIETKYALSSKVTLHWINTDHDFVLPAEEWSTLEEYILRWINEKKLPIK